MMMIRRTPKPYRFARVPAFPIKRSHLKNRTVTIDKKMIAEICSDKRADGRGHLGTSRIVDGNTKRRAFGKGILSRFVQRYNVRDMVIYCWKHAVILPISKIFSRLFPVKNEPTLKRFLMATTIKQGSCPLSKK